MSLRLKLFITVGILFLIIALFSYFLPAVLLKRDNIALQQQLTADTRARYMRIIEQNTQVLNTYIQEVKGDIDSILYLINSSLNLEKVLSNNKQLQELAPWQRAGLLLSFNDRIGFIQQTHNGQIAASILLDQTPIYLAKARVFTDKLAYIALDDTSESNYLGVQLPFSSLVYAEGPQPYYLFPWEILLDLDALSKRAKDAERNLAPSVQILFSSVADSALVDLDQTIAQLYKVRDYILKETGKATLDQATLKQWLSNASSMSISKQEGEENKRSGILSPYSLFLQQLDLKHEPHVSIPSLDENYDETIVREHTASIVRQLTDFVYVSLGITSPFDAHAPKGVAYADAQNATGLVFLVKDMFFDTLLFNDKTYYEKYPPLKAVFPVASSLALIQLPLSGAVPPVFLGDTLKLNTEPQQGVMHNDYFTIGIRLRSLLENLALSANVDVVMVKDGRVIEAITSQGGLFPETFSKAFPTKAVALMPYGTITVGDEPYMYANVKEIPEENLSIYFLLPSNREFLRQINKTLQFAFQSLSQQLLGVTLCGLVIALILLALISKRVTKPIAALAKATEEIAAGHYTDIELPKETSEHDEVSILSHSFHNMVEGLQEREKIRGVLNKVVSKDVADEILKGSVHLGGEERIVTVLFADIRNFTKMTEHMKPHEVITMLNEFMTKMSRFIDAEGGVIDKYIGDEIMAIFGAPIEQPDSAWRAVKTAVEMIQFLKEWNEKRRRDGIAVIEIGIGIHTGPVVAGNMGAEFRLNYTVLGSTVNLAARLCDQAKPMQILTTRQTLDASKAQDKLIYEEEAPLEIKGFSEPVTPYGVIGFLPNLGVSNQETSQ